MRFTSRALSEKLLKLGCKPENINPLGYGEFEPGCVDVPVSYMNDIPAFCLEDFVGTSKQSKENAKIVWGNEEQRKGKWIIGTLAQVHRHVMIESEDWVSYLEETMRKE